MALAAQRFKTKHALDCLSIAARWLVDTGCGKDLISLKHASLFNDQILTIDPMIFGTANGLSGAFLVITIKQHFFYEELGQGFPVFTH